MLRHVVVFRWQDGASPDQVAAVLDGLAALPGRIPAIRRYRFGADLGLSEGNWDLAVVADVDDPDALVAYRSHPAHQALLRDRIQPILAERAAVQFALADGDA